MNITAHLPVSAEARTLTASEGVPLVVVFRLAAAALLVLLIGVIWRIGARRQRARPPRPEEQPRRPDQQAAHTEARRELDGFPQEGGARLAPHKMPGYGNLGSKSALPAHPRESDESGGAFGSGGLGG
ncbi:DUF6479 family protein [Streptomyces sp. NBC_00467]|uniref:DUF6479 family protein n=1 Tax=Streptomyces sp. NBC_00467 TaxID=2975752 RepID=UPI002E17E462